MQSVTGVIDFFCTLSWIVFIIALLKSSETWRIRRTEIFSINSVAQWNVNHTTDLNSCASCAWTCNEWARKINISTLESLLAWDTVISAGGGLLNRCSPGCTKPLHLLQLLMNFYLLFSHEMKIIGLLQFLIWYWYLGCEYLQIPGLNEWLNHCFHNLCLKLNKR